MRKCPLCKNELTGKPRTIPQNNYLHLLFSVAGEHCGYDTKEMKQVFSELILDPKEIHFVGKTILIYPSTSDMTKVEMMDYIDKILMNCLQAGMENMPLINDTY